MLFEEPKNLIKVLIWILPAGFSVISSGEPHQFLGALQRSIVTLSGLWEGEGVFVAVENEGWFIDLAERVRNADAKWVETENGNAEVNDGLEENLHLLPA